MKLNLESCNLSRPLPDCDDLSKVELIIIHLGNEDGRHGFVQCGAVHVNGGPHRKYKTDDASINVVVLQEALEGDRQSGRAAPGNTRRCMVTVKSSL